MSNYQNDETMEGIAVIGMSCRFSGAKNIEEFWQNLRDGVESITFFTEEELVAAGVNRAEINSPGYVKANGMLEGIDMFDAPFFGISPREAALMDPQYRFFMQCAWEALETACYDPFSYEGLIGIFGGMSTNQYMIRNLLSNKALVETEGPLQIRILNDKDFLASLTAYKLNLRGPSVTVQTACSTSLVAVSLACQSLLNYQCDLALAGGVTITLPQISGYYAQTGVISPDGHCRAFDAQGRGTVNGNGVGMVALKRLDEAVKDRDTIYAVIKGSAINNDGSGKVGYTAPGIEGQTEVIAMAQAIARVAPETITYIEAHGTATPMGDPVEIATLTQAFRMGTDKTGFCAIGSVKTNIGHLDAAAGVASLIKTALSLKHKSIPASLHFKNPNPEIAFSATPFYVNTALSEWKTSGFPRRAGVSSFAVGGVNAHLIVEEAPAVEQSSPSPPWQLILLSAKTRSALDKATQNLALHLMHHPDEKLADVAYTLMVGRAVFNHRRFVVARDIEDAANVLAAGDMKRVLTGHPDRTDRPITFMFPGLGNHYANMASELYRAEPFFRQEIDRCCELLKKHMGEDLRDLLYPEWREPGWQGRSNNLDSQADSPSLNFRKMLRREQQPDPHTDRLNQTLYVQPILFVIEYALARLWMNWKIVPQSLIGYSIGEYVAACLAEVFSLEDALYLVAERAKMIQELPGGAMLAVPLSEDQIRPLLNDQLSLAAINGPEVCIVSGEKTSIADLAQSLSSRGIACQMLQVSHAFHSKMMHPLRSRFAAQVKNISLKAPVIPLISNVSGTWMTDEQATDPNYWSDHLCRCVQFSDAIAEVWRMPGRILLEIGPGNALGAWALQHPQAATASDPVVMTSLPHSYDSKSDLGFILNSLGRLWLSGISVAWPKLYEQQYRQRVLLPTYPFDLQRYWIERQEAETLPARSRSFEKNTDISEWFYTPAWKQSRPLPRISPDTLDDESNCWMVFCDEGPLSAKLVEGLKSKKQTVISVKASDHFAQQSAHSYTINPQSPEDYTLLFNELDSQARTVRRIIHLWSVFDIEDGESRLDFASRCQKRGFYSLLLTGKALGNRGVTSPVCITVVSTNLHCITGGEQLHPEKATILGPCKVIPQEYQDIDCVSIDLADFDADQEQIVEQLIAETMTKPRDPVIAYRRSQRWAQTFDKWHLSEPETSGIGVRENGTYLILGGLGGIGLVLSDCLARLAKVRLVLVGRSAFPARDQWQARLVSRTEDDPTSSAIRKLLAIEERGTEILILRADVTDREQMQGIIDGLGEGFGPINGIIHAAGVSPGGIMQVKTAEMAEKVLAPKIKGTLILDELFKDTDLDFFILCSSLVSIYGGIGMVDHCGANAFLDAFAQSTVRQMRPRAVSINWDAWQEVGQAATAQLSAGLQRIKRDGKTFSLDHPLLSEWIENEPGKSVFSVTLSTKMQWVIDEHRIMGQGILPGTAYLEMILAAFEQQAPGREAQIHEIIFEAPLIVRDGEQKEVCLEIEQEGSAFRFRVISKDGADSDETDWSQHATGRITCREPSSVRSHDLAAIIARCSAHPMTENNGKKTVGGNGFSPSREGKDEAALQLLGFGPRWQNTSIQIFVGNGESLAVVELPNRFASDLQAFKIHPVLMDAATGFVQHIGEGHYLPFTYKNVRVKGNLPSRIYSYASYEAGASTKQTIACRLVVTDEQGTELVEIEEYILKRVESPTSNAGSENSSDRRKATRKSAAGIDRQAGSPIESVLTKVGILPHEGAETFARILARGLIVPQITVSTRELLPVIEQARRLTAATLLEEIEKIQSSRPKHPRPNLATEFVAPRNDLETALTVIWQEALGIQAIGIHDNFFDMGGDSLLATHIISRLTEQFDCEFSLKTIFEAPTVADLALVVLESRKEMMGEDARAKEEVGEQESVPSGAAPARKAEVLRILPQPRESNRFPLSFAQQRLWFLEQLIPGTPTYNIPLAVHMSGRLDIEALKRCIEALINRHETLRTSFYNDAGQPVQVIEPVLKPSLNIVDLRGHSEAGREIEARRLAQEDAQQPFSLGEAPLMRASLLRLVEDREHILLITIHHIISDKWSLDILLHEIVSLYDALSKSKPSPLPGLPVQYADFAIWQREHLQGTVIETQFKYWKANLANAQTYLNLTTDRPRPAVQSLNGAKCHFTFDDSLAEATDRFSHSHNSTLFMTLLAAFKATLFKVSAQKDIVIGTTISGRNRVQLQGLIGFFANMLPLRTQLADELSFRDLMARVRAMMLSAYANQDLPFDELIKKLQLDRDPSRHPLFQILFNLQ
ncbi:MAG: SDR family NAD(P)-dependent oxidoreductase, partial [Blastocatellia bacterium]